MPENNTTLSGGAIDRTTVVDFSDMTIVDQLQVVSSNPGDTASVVIYGRLANGIVNNETVALVGQSPAVTVQTAWERIMKVLKLATTAGDVAVEQVTPVASGTVVDGGLGVDTIELDGSSSNVDNAYVGLVFRVLTGTGAGVVAKILSYEGDTQTAVLDKLVTVDSTSTYRLSRGVILNKAPIEIMTVRRPFYNALAAAPSGDNRVYYEKFFWRNDSSEDLLISSVLEVLNASGKISFGVDPTVPSTSSVANRLTAPVIRNLVFGRTPQSIPTNQSTLASGQAVGVWLRFAVNAGQSPQKLSYMSGLSGQTN